MRKARDQQGLVHSLGLKNLILLPVRRREELTQAWAYAPAAETHNVGYMSSFVIDGMRGSYLEMMGDPSYFLSPHAPPQCCYQLG